MPTYELLRTLLGKMSTSEWICLASQIKYIHTAGPEERLDGDS